MIVRPSRRSFVTGLALGTAGTLAGCGRGETASPSRVCEETSGEGEVGITPGEDLMREHGVLERVLVVWGEVDGPLRRGEEVDAAALRDSLTLVQRFVEQYHERLEEDVVFPRLESAGREVELVRTLREQHEAGRSITAEVVRLLGADLDAEARTRIADRLGAYTRMYLAHAAREDTIVFPALREITGAGYAELGEELERREHRIVGEGGFEQAVAEADRIERAFGLDRLARFTPEASPA
jgi:hemerythrin-like domain-containing protein